jgi:hypothetical protein
VYWRTEAVYRTSCGSLEENGETVSNGSNWFEEKDTVCRMEDNGCVVEKRGSVSHGLWICREERNRLSDGSKWLV